jgi:transcriptional regulator with XRE-family HTH domain
MAVAGVGGLLRKARIRLKLTLREVSGAVGVSIAYISDVELGRREVAPKRVPQFAKALAFTDKEKHALYRAAGVLPQGLTARLLRSPELWNADFIRLVPAIEAAILALDLADRACATALRKARDGA